MHLKKIIATAIAFAFVSVSAFAVTVDAKIAAGSAKITKAEILAVGPLNVLPGTLVTVEGTGFGTTPTAIKVGSITVDKFVGWEDTAIFFLAPAGIKAGDVVTVGNATANKADYGFMPADADSVTVQWVIDSTGATFTGLSASLKSQLSTIVSTKDVVQVNKLTDKKLGNPAFTGPMWVKGQWIKKGTDFGKFEASWDGGSRIRMVNLPGTTKWVAEAVFTPANVGSFLTPQKKPKPMLFAFEDGNYARNTSEFESDWAMGVKKDMAKATKEKNLSLTQLSDPSVYLAVTSKDIKPEFNRRYDAAAKKVVIVFPVE